MNVAYLPGSDASPELPLERFLPPIPREMVSTWCRQNLNPGDWVLDPFGFNPMIPVEAAAAGHPVLVTVNNPIHAFLLRVIASAPQREDFIAALQELANSRKGEERMESYIRSLYLINCLNCGRQIEADAFLWKKGEDHPYATLVDCPFCGVREEQAQTDQTLNSMTPIPPKRLHQARALNRIAAPDDPLRTQVENAINAYPTRPLIILQTIINKLESIPQTPQRTELLIALILSAADYGNTLWSYPSPRNRPRQIVIPSLFQERNLWKVLEEAVEEWLVLTKPIPLSSWQGAPDDPKGIYIFQGRIKELNPQPQGDLFSAVVTAIPRPNQAFWTLSALWTGWIWGQEAVTPIRQVLSRQRYDWNWHTNALKGVFESIHDMHNSALKFWGLIAENEPMLLIATLLAADSSGHRLSGFAMSLDDQLAQCSWKQVPRSVIPLLPPQVKNAAKEKIRDYLRQKGEPAAYQQVHASAVTGLANENMLSSGIQSNNNNQQTSDIQKWVDSLFTENNFLIRVSGGTASLETGDWWLADPESTETPLIDRVEELVVQHLVINHQTTSANIKKITYQALPGIFTPENDVLLNCLESYANYSGIETHLWELRVSENPAARSEDIKEMHDLLTQIALRLNYRVTGEKTLYWYEGSMTTPEYRFDILSSAMVSSYFNQNSQGAMKNILVLPGSRANLLAYKKQRDAVLGQTLDRDFHVIKFRLVRDLAANLLLSRDLFNEQIHEDQPEYRTSQMVLF